MRVLNEKLEQKVVSCWSIVLCEATFGAAVVQINTVVVLSLMLDALIFGLRTILPLDYSAPELFGPRTSNTIPRAVINDIFEKKSHPTAVYRFGKNERSPADFKYDNTAIGLQKA